jgi:serine protease Do
MKLSQHIIRRFVAMATLVLMTSPVSAEMTPESLKAVEAKVRSVVEKALPCTVAITSERTGAAGSGVIVSSDGLILTAGHVTRATGDELLVFLTDGTTVKATALGADYRKDSGMARIIDDGEYPFVKIGDSTSLEENEWCIALGHTAGYQPDRTPPVRLGRILSDRVGGFISTDCALTGGDSGGPLFDLNGELIGIHSNIGNSLMENRHIPIETYQSQWNDMVEGARLNDWNGPMLGVWLDEDVAEGVRVEVMPDGPAAKAGLETNDIIVAVKGKPTLNGDKLLVEIAKCRPQEPAEIEVLRGDERLKIEVTPTRRRQLMRSGPWSRRQGPQRERQRQEESGQQDQDEGQTDKQQEDQQSKEPEEGSTEKAESGDAPATTGEQSSDADVEKQGNTEEQSEAERLSELEQELANRIRDAHENGGEVEIPQELKEKYPNLQELARRMAGILGRGFNIGSPGEDKFFTDVVNGYRPIIDDVADSVVKVMVGPKQVALGTVIRQDGYVLTKASEIKDSTPTIELADGERFPASVEKEFGEYDLALLRVPKKLTAVEFSSVSDELPLGTFVSAVGVDPTPLAIGVLSVARRSLAARDKPFLGVSLRPAENGLAINSVVPESAAATAGLKPGDVIVSLNGKPFTAVPLFILSLGRKRPGDEIKLALVRDDVELEKVVKLGGRTEQTMDRTRGRYPTGGKLSDQRDGYPNALQTDLPFRYNECGSPLVDLDGRIIGLNIARAGRTKSYAIPAGTISDLLKEALPQ